MERQPKYAQRLSQWLPSSALVSSQTSAPQPGGYRLLMIQTKCWASDSQRTTQIPSWPCNHRPAVHSLRDNA